jgi:hypothetical protein
MKQAQYAIAGSPKARRGWPVGTSEALDYPAFAPPPPARPAHRPVRLVGSALWLIWMVLTLPFRLVIGVLGLISRLCGIALGFTIMVIGMALCAGPLCIIGIPTFLIGLLLTLRCLG